jgi:hypothetical protein
MLPDVESLTADKSYDPTRAMVVMHPERFSPDEASRPAFHREPSAGCPQHSETLYRQRHKRREHVREAKRLAAGGVLNSLRTLLQRYLIPATVIFWLGQ